MKRIAFFDTKPYDRLWFDRLNNGRYEIVYFEGKLNENTVRITDGFDGVCGFVNDDINAGVIAAMAERGVQVLAMRSAGYSNVDCKAALNRIKIVRVPFYSPYAVAEHAMGLLLTVNRKLARAVTRTRDFNFSIVGLMGTDLHGKTVGVIGTGTIGRVFIDICRGFGMKIIAYDPFPAENSGIDYVPLSELFQSSDVISLHCPLTDSSFHILDEKAFGQMKQGGICHQHLARRADRQHRFARCAERRKGARRGTGCLRGGNRPVFRGQIGHHYQGRYSVAFDCAPECCADLPSGLSDRGGIAGHRPGDLG